MADNTNNHQSILNASVSDQASENDYLGFEPYVVAIAEFLTNPETKPPLTLSIEGEWGSGKSSFMKQLEKFSTKILSLSSLLNNLIKRLKLKLKIITFRPPTTVWFNAWRHDKAEALWAAFSLEFLRQISQIRNKRDVLPVLNGKIKLLFLRFNWGQGIVYLFYGLVGLLVLIYLIVNLVKNIDNLLEKGAKFIAELILQKDFNIPLFILRFITIGSSIIGVFSIVLRILNVGNPKNDLTKYLKSPKYENQIEFIEEFHADFKKIVEAFAGKNKVYVFKCI